METIVVFKIGDKHIGIDIRKVVEVTEIHEPVMVPRSPDYIVGLVNVRGDVIPVLSLRRRLGIKGDEESNVMLIVEDNGRVVGFKVDALCGTQKIKEDKIKKTSELRATKKEKNFVYGVYEIEKEHILILNLEKTLSKEDS